MAAKTKEDIVSKISQETGIAKNRAKKVVDSFLESIVEGLQDGSRVTLAGFGTFQVKQQSSRNVRNPQTGEEMVIPSKNVPKFNPGKGLKDILS